MKNYKHITLALLILFISLMSCREKKKTFDPNELYSVEQLREDLNKVRDLLIKNHPNLYYNYSRSVFNKHFNNTYKQINDSMTITDFYILLSQLVSKVHCGRTYVDLPEFYRESMDKYYNYFPCKLYYQNNRAFVLSNFSGDSTVVPGSEILSINKVPMSRIINNLLETTSADGYNQTYKYYKMNLKEFGLFPGYAQFPESYQFQYISPGASQVKNATFPALSHQQIIRARQAQHSKDELTPIYDLQTLDSLNIAILTIRKFAGFDKSEYQTFLKNSFKTISRKSLDNLILDVRNNDGGDPYNAAELIAYFIKSNYVYFANYVHGYSSLKEPIAPKRPRFKGNLYVLINGGCFSTTGHFLSLIKYHDLGLLVGEETGGSYSCNGCDKEFTLHNTKIMLHYTECIYSTDVTGFSRERGIMPDLEVQPTIDDVINHRDRVMAFTLNLIKRDQKNR